MPRSLAAALVAGLCLAAAGWAQGQVLITEFLAKNQSPYVDEDGDSSDWIELYNSGPEGADLSECHLTDDPLNLMKWTLPTRLLSPGGYLVVFASGKDRREGEWHTNFSLHAAGEFLALTNPAGGVLSSYGNPFPPQTANVAYGLLQPLPGSAAGYFLTPTPGGPNNLGAVLSPAPLITPDSRTFLTSLSVSLTAPPTGAGWRYTLDGSLPVATSSVYSGPLTLTQTARLRVLAFNGTQVQSVLGGATFMQLSAEFTSITSDLPLCIIDDFNGGRPTNGNLAEWMLFQPNPSTGRSSCLALPDLASRTFIKVRGSSTASDAKYSLALETRNQLDQDAKTSPFGLPANGDWVLNAPFIYDRTLIHNRLAYALDAAQQRYAVRTRPVELYLNTDGGPISAADYMGVYTFEEKIEQDEDRIDVEPLKPSDTTPPALTGGYVFKIDRADPGDIGITINSGQTFYLVDPKEQQITTTQRAWLKNWLNGWWASLNSVQFSDPTQGYAAYLDVPSALDHHILSVAMKNLDALRLSTFLFKDRQGKLHYGPLWDFDRSLESLDGRDDNYNTWRGETGDLGTDYFRYYEWAQMFQDTNFWQQWIDRYTALRQTTLATANVQGLVDQFATEVAEAQGRNFAKWTAVPPRTSWAWEVQHLREWFVNRLNWMDAQFTRPATCNAPSPTGGIVSPGFALTLTSPSLVKPGTKIYYTLDGTDPRQAAAPQDPNLVLISSTAPAKGLLPTSDIGTAWHGSTSSPDPFNDSAWLTGTNGIGYDDTPDYDSYIGINFEAPNPVMKNVQGSAYQRIKFILTATQLATIQGLELRVHYDDGFVAYLNGSAIASANAPATGLTWNSEATTGHADSDAILWSVYDVQSQLTLLHVGENVLACHGLNTPKSSTDFLCQVELIGHPTPPQQSPNAIEYTGPITISTNRQLIARVYDPAAVHQPYPYAAAGAAAQLTGSHWSAPLALSLFTTAVPASPQNVALTEIMYHPAEPTAAELAAGFRHLEDFQYVILRNLGTTSVSLAGIHFLAGIAFTATSVPTALLLPGATVAVVKHEAAFRYRYGSTQAILGSFTEHLSRNGEFLYLLDPANAVLGQFTYSDAPPWPVDADGLGYSLVLTNPALQPPLGNGANWRLSLDPGGEDSHLGTLSLTQWQARYFTTPADAALTADPDHDGLDNLMEYALGTRPTLANGIPWRWIMNAGGPAVEFSRRKGLTNVFIAPQWSNGLNQWTGPAGLLPSAAPNLLGTESVLLPVPNAADAREFFRLLISQP